MPISREDFLALDYRPKGLDDIIGNFILKRDPIKAYSKKEIYTKATKFAKMYEIYVDKSKIDKVLDMLVEEEKVEVKPKLSKRQNPYTHYMWAITDLGRPEGF